MISFDYLLITKHGEATRQRDDEAQREILLKILVVKDSMTKSIFAHVVPAKGPGEDRFAVECLRSDILWLGHQRVLLRCDREPAIRALLREVLREVKVSVDQAAEKAPPPYDSQANGDVENAIKQV